jgi:protein ImuA
MLAARVMAGGAGPVVWARPAWATDRLNPAGLQPLADPGRLILVAAARDEGLLWAMEEALRSGAVPLVVAELAEPPGLTLVRRLHLAAGAGAEAAARAGQVAPLGLILTPGGGGAPGVESRWHLAPLPSPALLWSGGARWRLERLRARLAPPAAWQVTAGPDGAASLALLPPAELAPAELAPDQAGPGMPRDPG